MYIDCGHAQWKPGRASVWAKFNLFRVENLMVRGRRISVGDSVVGIAAWGAAVHAVGPSSVIDPDVSCGWRRLRQEEKWSQRMLSDVYASISSSRMSFFATAG